MIPAHPDKVPGVILYPIKGTPGQGLAELSHPSQARRQSVVRRLVKLQVHPVVHVTENLHAVKIGPLRVFTNLDDVGHQILTTPGGHHTSKPREGVAVYVGGAMCSANFAQPIQARGAEMADVVPLQVEHSLVLRHGPFSVDFEPALDLHEMQGLMIEAGDDNGR